MSSPNKSQDIIVIGIDFGTTPEIHSSSVMPAVARFYMIETVEPFVVKECVQGDGGLHGGIFLDESFLRLIQTKVGPLAWKNVTQAEKTEFLNDNWEHGIKPQFRNQARTWLVELPDGCQVCCSSGTVQNKSKQQRSLELSSQEILSVFESVTDRIKSLVESQCKAVRKRCHKEPKYVVLVGGFGRSQFLFESIKAAMSRSTTVLQSRGSKPWSAICRGAVVQGLTACNLTQSLSIKVEARIARASYGIVIDQSWDNSKQLSKDKYWDEIERSWWAGNQMDWFLRKGDDITAKKPVKHEFYQLLSEAPSSISDDLHICTAWPLPHRLEQSVQKLCTITWNQTISFEELPTWTNSLGKIFRRLTYTIEMRCDQGTVEFAVYFQGNRIGGRNVQVDYS